jgi:hypothetical protein
MQVRKVPAHLRQDIYEFYRTMYNHLRNISLATEILDWLRFTYVYTKTGIRNHLFDGAGTTRAPRPAWTSARSW